MNPLSESTYLVLLALYREPLHGYGIIKSLENSSEGDFLISPGTLYGVLNNLEKQKMIEAVNQESASRKKKTYGITEQGKQTVLAESDRFLRMIQMTRKLMDEREN